MNKTIKKIVFFSLAIITSSIVAKENVNHLGATVVVNTKVVAGCAPSASKTDLDINNVRATIMGAGDMWWNLSDAQYEIPKGGNKNSLFAGALWIGGVDDGGQLKVAAMTYRQSGDDFWPGPLDEVTATITSDECYKWDQHFKVTRAEVEEHVARFGDPTYVIPNSILDWPASGSPFVGADRDLAPFFDFNEDGRYDPYDGDYPDYNITGTNKEAALFGDQTLWWVFNDKGNIHTEFEATPVGIEIHAQAFGFAADNEVNDMTFYNYKIINRSTLPLNNTYFGQWVDPDLGNYLDDYVGCDVELGLGFCYNGDAEDEGATGYGFNPPAIGVDFFQGPLADAGDGVDNDRDGTIDEAGEQIIMSKFVYYDNTNGVPWGNPNTGTDIYNYLRGIWLDNVPMTWGGDGRGGSNGGTATECDFMFPGTSDPTFQGQEWTEVTAGNVPNDRRFIQSAGAFTLNPGDVNTITTGVVWARAKSGGPTASVKLVKVFDQVAQALFDSNFDIINGPDAPDLTIRELDKELIITLSNGPTSNNINESYAEKDPYIQNPINIPDNVNYEFQGYLVYQLKNATVSVTDLDDLSLARMIYRSDINDGVGSIVNQYFDPELDVWFPQEEISGVISEGLIGSIDEGIQYSFQVTEDQFALGNKTLVNHKTYYFLSIAYAYNEAEINENPYNNTDPNYDGRNRPYLQGRRNIKLYSGIPHFTTPEAGGTTVNAAYGEGVVMTRLEGKGNGGNNLDFTDETVTEILNSENHRALNPSYKSGASPIEVTVVDPVKIPKGTFILKLENPVLTNAKEITSYTKWSLIDEATGDVKASANQDIVLGSEKYISALGLNVKVKQAAEPGSDPELIIDNGFISGSMEFTNVNDRWLTGVADRDISNGFNAWGLNWIRAGSYEDEDDAEASDYNRDEDPKGVYEGVVVQTNTIFGGMEVTGGTWSPYSFVSNFNDGPGYSSSVTNSYNKIQNLNSVDVILTTDKTKWTRVCVVEAQDNPDLAIGGQVKMGLRQSPSVDKEGNDDGSGTMGMGWFPGYALDLETGERLNIIFSEDSYLTSENGGDMLWNPTSNIVNGFPQYNPTTGEFSGGTYLLGGKHFIYVVNGDAWVKGTEDYINGDLTDVKIAPNYDESAWIYEKLATSTQASQSDVFKHVGWVGAPLLAPGRSLLTNDVKIKLRVTKPYKQYESVTADKILDRTMPIVVGSTYSVAYYNNELTNSQASWGGKAVSHDGNTYEVGETFVATSTSFTSTSNKARIIEHPAVNGFSPAYRFNTDDIVAVKGQLSVAKDAMELINVVPNPYYGYSSYETNQLDNRVKITNLPTMATISIFTVSGTLVRKLKKDDKLTSIDWDLKNDYGIPVASGLYVIHVRGKFWDNDAKEFVEKDKVIKWFGALRPIDLDTF